MKHKKSAPSFMMFFDLYKFKVFSFRQNIVRKPDNARTPVSIKQIRMPGRGHTSPVKIHNKDAASIAATLHHVVR
jgi:hypothetical protein